MVTVCVLYAVTIAGQHIIVGQALHSSEREAKLHHSTHDGLASTSCGFSTRPITFLLGPCMQGAWVRG